MPRKMENQQLVSPSRQCTSTPVGFGRGFLTKEQCDNTGASPILLTWLRLTFTCSLDWNQEWRYDAFVRLLISFRMRRKSWKCFQKWLPGMFSIPLQSPAEVNSWTRGLFWRKCSLHECVFLYFWEIQWFQEHFEAPSKRNELTEPFLY